MLASYFLALEDIPNQQSLELAPTLGWWMYACVLCAFLLFFVQGDRWRRFWLRAEDPRPLALFRIVFAFFVICNMNDLWEHFRMLFTSEGIYTADVARQVHAAGQFNGFGDGIVEDEPWGFFDRAAFYQWLEGPKYSLLHFWDSVAFFWFHLVIFWLAAGLWMIGLWTRVTGVLSFFLMMSIFYRNHLFWEGTEVVYIVFHVYLLFSKCGHAYSVDNWLRCRKLRKRGQLSERDGPGGGAGLAPCDDFPRGLAPVYRLIPAWPRILMMLQLGTIMTTTGTLKNGHVWAKGDAVYYAWNLDHFYRFYPQQISSIIGTNLLRLSTWIAHWGEVFFGIIILGVVWRWVQDEPPLSATRRWAMRLAWAGLVYSTMMVVVTAWPTHVPDIRVEYFIYGWLGLWGGLWALWWRLGVRPLRFKRAFWARLLRPLLIVPAWLLGKLGWQPGDSEYVEFSRESFRRWTVGRRVWATIFLLIMGGIFFLMNIGQFQTGMLSALLVFLKDDEPARALRWIGRRLPRSLRMIPDDVRRGESPLPAQDPTLPDLHRDTARFPTWALTLVAAAIFGGVAYRATVDPKWPWWEICCWVVFAIAVITFFTIQPRAGRKDSMMRYAWTAAVIGGAIALRFAYKAAFGDAPGWVGYAALGLALVAMYALRPRHAERMPDADAETGRITPPWAYGPWGRMIVSGLVIWHIAAVAIWLVPDKDICKKWRDPGRRWFSGYLHHTYTSQGWGMFAPNPPRANVFLKIIVYDAKGEPWDLKSDMYAPEKVQIPFIWNDRMRKMNRRMVGKGKMYRKWYARWLCREWQRTHGGEIPEKIELIKFSYALPTPEQARDMGWYRPMELMEIRKRESTVHTESCKSTIMGQLSNEERARYELPPLPDDVEYKANKTYKKRKWERSQEAERRKREREAAERSGKPTTTPPPPPNLGDPRAARAAARSVEHDADNGDGE
ncbi:MAG: hypothetical protein KC636_37300 [Myxococcales bacterium]|nr:hypothetical protein [Myxococcales bacterium]